MNDPARERARRAARRAAGAVPDPEIPCVTVEDLGILVDVEVEPAAARGGAPADGGEARGAARKAARGAAWIATARVTPTYSGCPAVLEIERAVGEALAAAGFEPRVERVSSPAWTTDRITARGRERLAAAGIAPPACAAPGTDGPVAITFFSRADPRCPRCGSHDTERLSEFGSTACKAHHRCRACREPFDHFKPL